jgi:class 3 adenylate cyclase
MKCPKCQFENPDGMRFCGKCGERLEITCPKCNSTNPHQFAFCGKCGQRLLTPSVKEKTIPSSESERKQVTVFFSDMSGYTAMTEKLDPEEVKEIMGRIFGEVAQVVVRYEGFIEKFIGDSVMALFGVPSTHEDDPVRAIRAALEIHDIVSSLSPRYEKQVGKPLVMHTGICSGLVVTGGVNLEKGTHGVLGDTINLAARLSGLAKPGEIVVSPETYHQAGGYFTFESLEPVAVKGKAEPIKPYKVLSRKKDPATTHRLSGMRAELIGRTVEMSQLQEALNNLKQGKGSIFSVVGEAGTGKSRLIEEFKATLDLNTIQWREGHAYAYAQNIAYYPLIDLLNRAYQIQEGDPPEQVKLKVETGSGGLIGDRKDLIPYIGSLYSLSYPEIEGVSPEFWKGRLHKAIQTIFAALTQRGPTVVCLEDLHWADLSSIELLSNILSEFQYPALFLCIYRSPLSIFTSQQTSGMGKVYQEIKLYDFSPSESQNMVESLLKSKDIPPELKMFIRTRVEGNPFYLEETINALIESETLVREDGSWKLTKGLSEANIPSTVQEIISARIDRLERETKRVLQEASVIGRTFLYEILNRISELREHVERSILSLERLDLIRVRSLQPNIEYIFKHALTQEVVYNGILKKERHNIHECIGLVMEELFSERLPEFYETLAFHFKQGHSTLKAID